MELWWCSHDEPFPSFQSTTQLLHAMIYVVKFGGTKRSGSGREFKYFPIGMNAHELLWR